MSVLSGDGRPAAPIVKGDVCARAGTGRWRSLPGSVLGATAGAARAASGETPELQARFRRTGASSGRARRTRRTSRVRPWAESPRKHATSVGPRRNRQVTPRPNAYLAFADLETAPFLEIFRNICSQPVAGDGLRFDTENILVEPSGRTQKALRVRISAQLASAIVQIDGGFGDAVTPGPLELEYPVLLDHPAPTLNPCDTVVAEKFEAIVALDLANSRMKDFYDLLAMSRLFAFEGAILAAAATFERRATAIPHECPPPLTRAFLEDSRKFGQWRPFLARDPLLIDEPDLRTVRSRRFRHVCRPCSDRRALGRWTCGRGWRPAT